MVTEVQTVLRLQWKDRAAIYGFTGRALDTCGVLSGWNVLS